MFATFIHHISCIYYNVIYIYNINTVIKCKKATLMGHINHPVCVSCIPYHEKVEHIGGVHSAAIFLIFHVFIDLWQQEKERRLRGKGIKRCIWECRPDCWAYHHSEWYSLITLLVCYSFFSASVSHQPTLSFWHYPYSTATVWGAFSSYLKHNT